MNRGFLLFLLIAIAVSSFHACRRSSNHPAPVVQIGSPYTQNMCGPHLFHYTESGNDPSHGSYSKHYDTTMSIIYVNDTFVYFESIEFRCTTATDTIVGFTAVTIPCGGTNFSMTYNRYTLGIAISWEHSYTEPGGTVYMGADAESWTAP